MSGDLQLWTNGPSKNGYVCVNVSPPPSLTNELKEGLRAAEEWNEEKLVLEEMECPPAWLQAYSSLVN